MSTTSTILHLTLPASDGSDLFSLDDQFLANWAILDDNPGVLITLAADLPTLDEAQLGRLAFLTDDVNQCYVWWNGTDWVPPNAFVNTLLVAGEVGTDLDMGGNSVFDALDFGATGTVTTALFVLAGVNFYVNAGTPVSAVTPNAVGDMCIDTGTPGLWQATGTGNTDWQEFATV